MKATYVLIATLGLSSLSSELLAGVTHCSNASTGVQYHLDTPDGGAPRPPIEYWIVNGQTYGTNACEEGSGLPCPGDTAAQVQATWSKERTLSRQQHGKPGEGDAYFERTYTARAKVSLVEGRKVLANTFVICHQSYHNGLPRP